jgi:hypothetical protein
VHTLCRSAGPYSIEVGGVLGADGPRLGRHLVTVRPDGAWNLDPEPGRQPTRPSASFADLIAAPALYDAHVHLHPDVPLSDYVAHGVGRIRDLGSTAGGIDPVPAARDCADPVPDIVLGGPMLDRPGPARLWIAAPWRDGSQLPALLDAAVERGAAWVKLYEGFPVELLTVAVREAHARGLRVTVHPGPGDYPAALAAGVDELQHLGCLIPPGPAGTHALLARWAARTPGDDWPRLPAGTSVCPTLLVQHSLVTEAERGWTFDGHDPRMAEFWRASAIAGRPWSHAELVAGRAANSALRQAVGELDRAGVRWVVGSDTPNPGLRPGRSMWQEMNLLIEAGLDASRVYRAGSVAPRLDADGTHPLIFLSPAAVRAGPFPVAPPAAMLLRGCLFRTTSDDLEESDRAHHLPA